jgi:uncharacterized protein (DUF362 family)/Pyruvate/2-oxoacid:ferredoxin oxidoreductase delta subunit
MHPVLIHPADYHDCRAALDRTFERFPVAVEGKSVLVKPNALRASDAEQGIVTHPTIVRAVVEKLEELGAAQITVGDNPGMLSYGANEQTFRQTGLLEAAKGRYKNIGSDSGVLDFNPKFLDRVSVSRAVLDADVFISVPKFKTHGLTVLSGAIKNSYGILPGAQKAHLHRIAGDSRRFAELMVEVFSLRVPDLFVVDAVVGMEGNGPASPDLREIGLVLSGDNGVALDATIARMMGFEPSRLPFFEMAKRRGLGDYDAAQIEVEGELVPIPGFKLPPATEEAAQRPTGEGEFFTNRIRLRPAVDAEACTGCGVCAEQCPVSALEMEGVPSVVADGCIACFCCQEICPQLAIQLG